MNSSVCLIYGIRTIAPRGKLPPVRVGVWVKDKVSFRLGGQPDNCPQGKLAPGQGQGLGQGQFWGGRGAIFLGGNCPRTPVYKKLTFFTVISFMFPLQYFDEKYLSRLPFCTFLSSKIIIGITVTFTSWKYLDIEIRLY